MDLYLIEAEIAFGAGIFMNIDKVHGMRQADDPNSVRWGRVSLDDMKNRVPADKDLYVICAAGKEYGYKLLDLRT